MLHGRYPASRHRRILGPYPYLDAPRPLAFAHRGGTGGDAENTLNAFRTAISAGYRYVETDTHASADGVAVLFHDDDLHRLTGDHRRVENLTWKELRSIRLDGEPLIPRLDDVLAEFPDVRLNIDVKSDASVAPTLSAVIGGRAVDRVLIGSFSDKRLARVRAAAGPRLATSMGPREVAALWAASRVGAGLLGFVRGAVAAQVPIRQGPLRIVDRPFLTHAHKLGLQVHVWTVDDPEVMSELLDLGVDGIMTDRIDILADVYRSRGHWPT